MEEIILRDQGRKQQRAAFEITTTEVDQGRLFGLLVPETIGGLLGLNRLLIDQDRMYYVF